MVCPTKLPIYKLLIILDYQKTQLMLRQSNPTHMVQYTNFFFLHIHKYERKYLK